MTSLGSRRSNAFKGPVHRSTNRYTLVGKFRCRSHAGNGGGGTGGGGGGKGRGGSESDNSGGGDWSGPIRRLACGAALGLVAVSAASVAADELLARRLQPHDTARWRVSIVVPVLNEAPGIEDTITALRRLRPPPYEIIVVDGGSTDGTPNLARRTGARVIRSKRRGRAAQMNAGAAAAGGEVLAFVHADSRPPEGLVEVLRGALRDPKTVLCGFDTAIIEDNGRRMGLMTANNSAKTWYGPLLLQPLGFMRGLRCLFGDQTMCCRADDFWRIGGFDERWRIMEDAQLCLDLHNRGPRWPPQESGRDTSGSAPRPRRPAASEAGPAATRGDGGPGSEAGGGAGPLRALFPGRPLGRVHFDSDHLATTSGRRLAAWGPARATFIHLAISLAWYVSRDPQTVERLYERLYTDLYR